MPERGPFRLDRFREAQQSEPGGLATALAELRRGRKVSHWIWFVFPQLAGLGRSGMAAAYGIEGVGEAAAYLRDAGLRTALLGAADAVLGHLHREPPADLRDLMGSEIDVRKLVSSMTLFERVAQRLAAEERAPDLARLAGAAREILRVAEDQGFLPCAYTRSRIGG